MQFRFFTISFATVISASSVLADSNENGDSISCQVTAHIAQNTERNPTCHNGQGTIITTYPGTSFEERVTTVGDIAVNNGVCTVIIYPATSYPAVTATLPPCENSGEGVSNCQTIFIAQNTPRNPDCHTGQGKIVTTYSGTSFSEWRTTSIEADKCKIVVYPATSYPAVTATLTPCDGVEANDGSNPTTRIDADESGNSATTRIDADDGGNSDATTRIDADESSNPTTRIDADGGENSDATTRIEADGGGNSEATTRIDADESENSEATTRIDADESENSATTRIDADESSNPTTRIDADESENSDATTRIDADEGSDPTTRIDADGGENSDATTRIDADESEKSATTRIDADDGGNSDATTRIDADESSNPTTRIDADESENSDATTRIDADEGSDPTTRIDADGGENSDATTRIDADESEKSATTRIDADDGGNSDATTRIDADESSNPTTRIDADESENSDATTRIDADEGSDPTTRIDADGGGNSDATTRIDADDGGNSDATTRINADESSNPTTSIDADEKINCRTIVIPYNIPLPPTCHSGKNTVTKTYPPRHLTESRSTSFNAVGSKNFHPDNCAVIIYPATTYSASTAVLPPCKKSNSPNVVGVKGCPLVTRVQSPHRPMCHRGTKTITRVYPATSMRAKVSTSFKNTLLKIYDPNSCTKIFYPATFYPASTVTLKPCAKTVTRQPTRPFRISCVKKGSNPNRLAFATRVRRKSYISNDVVVIEPAKVFPRTTKKFPFCP